MELTSPKGKIRTHPIQHHPVHNGHPFSLKFYRPPDVHKHFTNAEQHQSVPFHHNHQHSGTTHLLGGWSSWTGTHPARHCSLSCWRSKVTSQSTLTYVMSIRPMSKSRSYHIQILDKKPALTHMWTGDCARL